MTISSKKPNYYHYTEFFSESLLHISSSTVANIYWKLLLANCFGIILNETLEVLLGVFVGLKNDDVAFWEEIKQQKGVETGE